MSTPSNKEGGVDHKKDNEKDRSYERGLEPPMTGKYHLE
jgi:hypothetical protein